MEKEDLSPDGKAVLRQLVEELKAASRRAASPSCLV
jgi:hypothetical protein